MTEEPDEIKCFSVTRYTKYGTCNIYLEPDMYEEKTQEEIVKIVKEIAQESDNWQLYDFEDQDLYEVLKND